ncbi:MAG TPA: dTMP kinase [Gemmatimonadales bacterium]|nr:dTMP kinase [Gemmatimonadales bacterium]
MSSRPGWFIVIEGPDGAGKSVLTAALAGRMRAQGLDPVVVREPGGTPAAEALRHEVLDRTRQFEPLTELLYILTARADLVHHVIRPGLEQGNFVVSDRFQLSTFAYQVAGRGVDPVIAAELNRAATGGLEPDLTIILDIPAQRGMERQMASGKRQDRLDLQDAGFQQRVTDYYLAAAGSSVRHLDGTRNPEQVEGDAWKLLGDEWPDIFK